MEKMEPLEQALEVVAALTDDVCKELGSHAKEHLSPDQLFARAEDKLNNGLTVDETIADIKASLMWDVQQKLENKIIKVKTIRENLLESAVEVMEVQEIQRKLERETEHLWSNNGSKREIGVGDISQAYTSAHMSASTSDSDGEAEVSSSVEYRTSPASKLTSSAEGGEDEDDDDIRVLTPDPRPAAPVIDITEDTADSTGSSFSQVLTSTQTVKKNKKIKTENNVAVNVAKQGMAFGKKNLSLLFNDEEMNKSEDEDDTTDSVKNCSQDGGGAADTTTETKAMIKDRVSDEGQEGEPPLSGSTDTSNSGDELVAVQSTQKPSENNLSTGANEEKEKNINKIMGFLMEGSPNVPDVSNNMESVKLWEEAHFICSLMPCFKLVDVYKSVYDNYYHPDRRTYVLREYIRLAVECGESLPEHVFQGLQAAKKRQHPNDYCLQPVIDEKKIKVENNVVNGGNALMNVHGLQNGISDSLPSTSGVSLPVSNSASNPSSTGASSVVAPTVTDDTLNQPSIGNVPGDIAAGIGKILKQRQEQVKSMDDSRKKWVKEKMDFVTAVTSGYHEEILKEQIESCWTDADVEAVVATLLEVQDRGQASQATIKSDVPLLSVGTSPENELPMSAGALPNHHPSTSAFQPVDVGGPSGSGLQQVVPGSVDTDMAPDSSAEPQPGVEGEDQAVSTADMEDTIMNHMNSLIEMFGDADPDYLHERYVGISGNQAKFQQLVDELLKNKAYPKIEDYIKRQKRLEIKKKFIEGMSVEEFLEYFEDPEKVFSETKTTMSATYMDNARAQLRRDLPFHLIRDIDSELRKHNFHYLPTLRALQTNEKLNRRKSKRSEPLKERDLDDIFIKELCYARMEKEIKEHCLKKEEDRRKAFLRAKTSGKLQECRCCYDDEVLEQDMDCCSEPGSTHMFCMNCIRRFAEEEIGQGRNSFRCLEGECKAEFSLNTLKKVMKPSIFSNILKQKQLEEIAAAGIEDLESCPFCSFQTIMPNKEDKVFKCLNPECMKDSCRFCKEPNHVPLRCEEVEKTHQKDARTQIENKMTEAMVRECWKCKKRFIKEDGCNKMKCACGAMMCYKCRKPIKGYDHFENRDVPKDPTKCPLWSNSITIHAEEVRDVANEIKKALPADFKLVHNPLNDVPEVPDFQRKQPAPPPPPPLGQHDLRHMAQDILLHGRERMAGQGFARMFGPLLPQPQQIEMQMPQLPVGAPGMILQAQHHVHHFHHHHHTQDPRRPHPQQAYQWEQQLMHMFDAQWGQLPQNQDGQVHQQQFQF